MKKLLDFLKELTNRNIYHTLTQVRDEAVMVEIAVPGEKWEVEFFDDGHAEVEVFKSNGEISDEESIKRLFETFSD